MIRLARVALALSALFLMVPASAGAEGVSLFAGPSGSGTTCSSSQPCDLATAINQAADNQTVNVMPGTHQLATSTNTELDSIHIQAQEGQATPTINATVCCSTPAIWMQNGSLRRLNFEFTGENGVLISAFNGFVNAESLSIRGTAPSQTLLSLQNAGNSRIQSTVLRAEGSNSYAVFGNAVADLELLNVTALATGENGRAVYVESNGGNSSSTIRNSLLRGTTDIQTADGLPNTATANVDWSAFRTNRVVGSVTQGSNNYTEDPAFSTLADATGHLVPGSPLINRGTDLADRWPFDVDGQLRELGPAPDIGGDEAFLPPTALTGDASGVTTGAAGLTGSVRPNGLPTVYRFEYGTTTGYGSSTAELSIADPNAPLTGVDVTLSGLQPGTTYHYRLLATNEAGTTTGEDRTFTTGVPPVDSDGDGTPDADDSDDDNDGIPDATDAFPLDASRWIQPGSAPAETINGTARADVICGLGAGDIINGLQGDDTLWGDACNDKTRPVVGAQVVDGNDKLSGSEGNDTLYGAGGKDRLDGGDGNDKLFGGGGNDSLTGAAGNDALKGDSGNDKLNGGAGRDALDGGSGDDSLNGGASKNTYKGGSGNDTIAAANGQRETVDCGSGSRDTARVDQTDKVKGCEKVKRAK